MLGLPGSLGFEHLAGERLCRRRIVPVRVARHQTHRLHSLGMLEDDEQALIGRLRGIAMHRFLTRQMPEDRPGVRRLLKGTRRKG